MEILIKEVPVRFMNEFALFAKIDPNKIVSEKKVRIIASNNTRIRVHTSVKVGHAQKGINWKVDGYNLHKEESYNMMTHDSQVAHYFKSSKSQDKLMYREYLKSVVKQMCDNMSITGKIDKLTIELEDRFNNWK